MLLQNLPKYVSLALGAACAGVSIYAAVTGAADHYLAFIGLVMAAVAAVGPVLAEAAGHRGNWFRSIGLMLMSVAAIVAVVVSSAERVHSGKAGGEAERFAARAAADRAGSTLAVATQELAAAHAKAAACRKRCDAYIASETRARDAVAAANAAVTASQGKAVSEATATLPAWFAPVVADIGAFLFFSFGFAPGRKQATVAPAVQAAVAPAKPVRDRSAAARKGWDKRRRNAALATGKVVKLRA